MGEAEVVTVPGESIHQLLVSQEFMAAHLLRLEPLHGGEMCVALLFGSKNFPVHGGFPHEMSR